LHIPCFLVGLVGIERESLDIFGGGGSQILHFCYRYAQHFEIFAGISVLAPCVEIPLASFFLSALLFSLFKTQIFSHWPVSVLLPHHWIWADPFTGAAHEASGSSSHKCCSCWSCCLVTDQITGHMVIKTLEVSRFWPEGGQNVVGALTLIGMASTKHIFIFFFSRAAL